MSALLLSRFRVEDVASFAFLFRIVPLSIKTLVPGKSRATKRARMSMSLEGELTTTQSLVVTFAA